MLDSPEGAPLLLVAPKQSTYELERQLLQDRALPGYTRLHVLSFERLARWVFEELRCPFPELLDEQGRIMVLRGILAAHRKELKLFRASARLTGFSQQLSALLSELQRNRVTPENLRQSAEKLGAASLALKLQDLATLQQLYLEWLGDHQLQDSDSLLDFAVEALKQRREQAGTRPEPGLREIEQLWVDGFAEMAAQEQELLLMLLPFCARATITFCLEQAPAGDTSWLSQWTIVRKSYERFTAAVAEKLPSAQVTTEVMARGEKANRFTGSPLLQRLEAVWGGSGSVPVAPRRAAASAGALRVVSCADQEREASLAAQEVVRHVRSGGRYRDVTILVRDLESYHLTIQRIFGRYEIPLFLDRRESVSHHPLAELTRSALRTMAFGWQAEDWFAALKTGLVPAGETDIDELENEALARGWEGQLWQKPLNVKDDAELTAWVQRLQKRLVAPFQKLAAALGVHEGRCNGSELAAALNRFWSQLGIEEQLRDWAGKAVEGHESFTPPAVHATVWEQMNTWLQNLELAFPEERLKLREWLPILDAGLAGLTVGVIPPALDQVLVGAIDRSRNSQSALVLLLGFNEGVFPAHPEPGVLLNEADRAELERSGLLVDSARQQLARERYHAYVACTRATRRLVVTCALQDEEGTPLNPSPFFTRLAQLCPDVVSETVESERDWRRAEHVCELPLLRLELQKEPLSTGPDCSRLSAELAARLYGPVLVTSVSRLEQFAACPFKFFVHSGLRAEERKRYEFDAREQGTFQHDVLAVFHEELRRENKRWRDISPEDARQRIRRLSEALAGSYRDGLLRATEQSRFAARVMSSALQDFVATLVEWMRGQYLFEPALVELPFGMGGSSPAWTLDLENGHSLQVQGRIDRVDLFRLAANDEALCVVLDYKSGQKKLDSVLLAHGIQLQLLTYLNVLRHLPKPKDLFGAARIMPAGAFYVSFYGKLASEANRDDALAETGQSRKLSYRHTGRFDREALPQLDCRPDATQGDQFNFRRTNTGQLHKNCAEALTREEFIALLNQNMEALKRFGREIYAGNLKPDPFRKGSVIACDQCDYQSVCRVDPSIHRFRVLGNFSEPNPDRPCAPPAHSTASPSRSAAKRRAPSREGI